jgi:hypothetical protein
MRQFLLLGGAPAAVMMSASALMAGINPAVPVLSSPVTTVLVPTSDAGPGEGSAQTVSVCQGAGGQITFSFTGCPGDPRR